MNDANGQLRAIVERIENVHNQRQELARDIADIFKEAKGNGYDLKALKVVLARRRRDPADLSEQDALVELYESCIGSGTISAPRARENSEAA